MTQAQQVRVVAKKPVTQLDRAMLARRNADPVTISLLETEVRSLYNTIKTSEPTDTQLAELDNAAHELAEAIDKHVETGGFISDESKQRKTALVEESLILVRMERSRIESLKRFSFYGAVFAGGLIPFLLIFAIGNLPMFAAHRESILSSAIVFVPLGAVCVAAYMGAIQNAVEDETGDS